MSLQLLEDKRVGVLNDEAGDNYRTALRKMLIAFLGLPENY